MSAQTPIDKDVSIVVQVNVPVTVKVTGRWDAEGEESKISDVQVWQNGGINGPSGFLEHLSDEDQDEIDLKLKYEAIGEAWKAVPNERPDSRP